MLLEYQGIEDESKNEDDENEMTQSEVQEIALSKPKIYDTRKTTEEE